MLELSKVYNAAVTQCARQYPWRKMEFLRFTARLLKKFLISMLND